MASEKQLIDAKALCNDIEKRYCEPCKAEGKDYHEVACRACWVDDMRLEIEDAPAVDAVEVIRCKDCVFSKYFEESGTRKCRTQQGLYRTVTDEDYCSYGERKDNERKAD